MELIFFFKSTLPIFYTFTSSPTLHIFGLIVMILGFHRWCPGSIPGWGGYCKPHGQKEDEKETSVPSQRLTPSIDIMQTPYSV